MNDLKTVTETYSKYINSIPKAREFFNRPLTYTEKILFSHLSEPLESIPNRTKSFCSIKPDRVAMQDATAQMALLQFMNSGMKTTAVPTTVHCDHLITAINGAKDDLDNAIIKNKEVYGFQFHPEVTSEMIKNWYGNLKSIDKGTDKLSKILKDHKTYHKENYFWLDKILNKIIE